MKAPAYDLEEQTAKLGAAVIDLRMPIPETAVTRPLAPWLVRSATRVGASDGEAGDAGNTKDFRHKIALCRKESHDTKYWCRMMAKAAAAPKAAIRPLGKEACGMNLISPSIFRKIKPAAAD